MKIGRKHAVCITYRLPVKINININTPDATSHEYFGLLFMERAVTRCSISMLHFKKYLISKEILQDICGIGDCEDKLLVIVLYSVMR